MTNDQALFSTNMRYPAIDELYTGSISDRQGGGIQDRQTHHQHASSNIDLMRNPKIVGMGPSVIVLPRSSMTIQEEDEKRK